MLSSIQPTELVADPGAAPARAGYADLWPLVARVLAASAIGLAVVGLMGWVFNSALLRGLGNSGATMKAITALMLLLAVLAVLHLSAP